MNKYKCYYRELGNHYSELKVIECEAKNFETAKVKFEKWVKGKGFIIDYIVECYHAEFH